MALGILLHDSSGGNGSGGESPRRPKYGAPTVFPAYPAPPSAAPAPGADPGAAGAGAAGGSSGGSVDINGFPGVAQAIAWQQAQQAQLDAQLNAGRQQAIIGFGDPSLATQAGFGIDPQAAAMAAQNYQAGNSTLARLDHAHALNARAIVNALAAHGILNSGDYGYREGEESRGYGNSVYDAQQAVLSHLTDLYNSYLSGTGSLQQSVWQAQQQALAEYLANPDAYAGMFGGGSSSGATTGSSGGGGGAASVDATGATEGASALSHALRAIKSTTKTASVNTGASRGRSIAQ